MKTLAPLVIIPPDTDAATIAAMRKAGYIPILTNDTNSVKLITQSNIGNLLMSALHGLCIGETPFGDASRTAFTRELNRRLRVTEGG